MNVQHFISLAAFVTVGAQLIFLFNFFYSLAKGKKCGDNPWNATTLEWAIPSPPPHDNFAGNIPTVYRGAYEYGTPGHRDDFDPQWIAPENIAKG